MRSARFKIKLKIMNIIYLLLSAAAMVWYAITPFFKASVNWNVTAESLKVLVSDDALKDFGVTVDDLFSEQESFDLKVELTIDHKMLMDVWTTEDGNSYVTQNVVKPNVDAIISDVEPVLKNVVKAAAKGMLTTMVEDQLGDILGENEDLYEKLAESGLSKEDVQESIGTVMDTLLSDEAQTIDSVSEVLSTEYNKYADALGGEEKTPEQLKEDLLPQLQEYGLVDEEGNITDINEAIAALLEGMLAGGEELPEGIDIPTGHIVRRLFTPNAETPPEEPTKENPLTAKLVEVINNAINDDVKGYIVLGLKGMGIALVAFMFVWFIKLFRCLISFFKKKPFIRTSPLGIIFGIVQLVLGIITFALILVFKFDLLAKAAEIPFVGDFVAMIPSGLTLALTFSAFIPAALLIVNFLYSGIYGITKRRFKKAYKLDKREERDQKAVNRAY